ncbi:hypothetical protein ACFWHT_04285 [Microbacterium sp. NPDC058342]|uniref:hypothetical protein n=1 Tax=Microbacterium sp. NPDC058342 TaxID=3346454 RepID=UPI00365815AD
MTDNTQARADRWRKRLSAVAMAVLIAAGVAVAQPAAAATTYCVKGTGYYWQSIAEDDFDSSWNTAGSSDWTLKSANGQVLKKGTTSADGRFSACSPAAGASGVTLTLSSTASANGRVQWRTVSRTSLTPYQITVPVSGARTTAADGTVTIAQPNVQIDGNLAGAWHIIDTLRLLWDKRGSTGACWNGSACEALTFRWGTQTSGGGVWVPELHDVVLDYGDATSKHTILHEAGHWWQWTLAGQHLEGNGKYKGWAKWMDIGDCDPHDYDLTTNTTCAWTEGWANAVAAHALGDRRYVYADGRPDAVFDTTYSTADRSEGNITAALLGIFDVDGGFDRSAKAMGTLRTTFGQYYGARGTLKYNNAATDAAVKKFGMDPILILSSAPVS